MKNKTVIIAATSFASSNVLGGHYWSAIAIAKLLKDKYEVILLNPGARPSPVLEAPGMETIFAAGSPERPAPLRAKIVQLVQSRNVSAALAFDQKAGELLRPLAQRMGLGLVLVKPGGGQPRLYYPKLEHNIVFMTADLVWLKERNRQRLHVAIAAGRVSAPPQDLEAQAALTAEVGLKKGDMAIVRVGRLHPHYSSVNRAAFRLAASLRAEGLPARLVLIGTPQCPKEYEALMELKGSEDAIVCAEYYTNRASRLLGLFDYNVGTGRGFMEGAAMGQVMFCASQHQDHDLPMLVSDDNFQQFFADNFSSRIVPDLGPEANYDRIISMTRDPATKAALQASSRKWFASHFSVEASRQIYISMIEAASAAPEAWNFDLLCSELHLRFSVLLDRLRNHLIR